MKKGLLFIISLFLLLFSGCILSKTPTTGSLTIPLGDPMTFSVEVFPPGGTYTWTLDGAPLSNTGKSYVYTAEAGNHTLVVKATHFLGTDTQTWNIITPSPPVANAGPDQTVAVDVTVTLDGSGSTDPDNNIASYQWQQLDGPTVTLSNADTAIAQFTANVTVGSTLTFKLTVTDATNLQATDTCVITVTNLSDPIISLLNSLVPIPAGSFMMGSTDDEYGWAQTTTPVHQVTFQAFDIGAYEVTQAQYLALMGTNPSYFQGTSYPNSENNPVEWVSWYEARAFCTALSAMTGRTFTLPSESQWEYACRAGTTTLYSFGDSYALLDKYAWTWANSDGTGGPYGTHPIGTKLPNNWGLYDMLGNVWEWCLDSCHGNYTGAPTDGSAWEPEIGVARMVRGGDWYNHFPWYCQSAFRSYGYDSDLRTGTIGFRVVAIP